MKQSGSKHNRLHSLEASSHLTSSSQRYSSGGRNPSSVCLLPSRKGRLSPQTTFLASCSFVFLGVVFFLSTTPRWRHSFFWALFLFRVSFLVPTFTVRPKASCSRRGRNYTYRWNKEFLASCTGEKVGNSDDSLLTCTTFWLNLQTANATNAKKDATEKRRRKTSNVFVFMRENERERKELTHTDAD